MSVTPSAHRNENYLVFLHCDECKGRGTEKQITTAGDTGQVSSNGGDPGWAQWLTL
jgi:hypothetical protein